MEQKNKDHATFRSILAVTKFVTASYYISRIEVPARSALQIGLYKVVTAWKTMLLLPRKTMAIRALFLH